GRVYYPLPTGGFRAWCGRRPGCLFPGSEIGAESPHNQPPRAAITCKEGVWVCGCGFTTGSRSGPPCGGSRSWSSGEGRRGMKGEWRAHEYYEKPSEARRRQEARRQKAIRKAATMPKT